MNDPTLVTTPEVTIVYPEVFEHVAFGNSEPKYSATFLIDSDVDIKSLRAAVKSAAYAKWPNQESDFYTKLQLPLRNGNSKAVDENGKPDETNFYFNRVFFAAKSKWQPSIINVYGDPISEPDEIYGGCVVRAHIKFYGYSYMGKLGVGAGLQAICKISDGEPLGGGKVNTKAVFESYLKERPENPFETREFNETGQQGQSGNRIVGPDQDPWEPKQEPPGGMMRQPGDEEDIPF